MALKAGPRSGTCADVGTPTVPLAYLSAKRAGIFGDPLARLSISIVILPGAMGQATWRGNATVQMLALVLSPGVLLSLGGIT